MAMTNEQKVAEMISELSSDKVQSEGGRHRTESPSAFFICNGLQIQV